MKEDFVLIDLMQIESTTYFVVLHVGILRISSSLVLTLWYKTWTATDLFHVSSNCDIIFLSI